MYCTLRCMSELDRAGRSPLHYAAVDGDAELARKLLSVGQDVNLADKQGFTPLHFAAQAQSPATVALLLDNGAHIDAQNAFGASPLLIALLWFHDRPDTVRVLRDRGADLNLKNNAGISPEEHARRVTNFDLVKVLLTDEPI